MKLLLAPIYVYQRLISPALPRRCKYEPTCSHYAAEALSQYGPLKGLILALWRLLRCNPFSHGGFDPVDQQRLFKQANPALLPPEPIVDSQSADQLSNRSAGQSTSQSGCQANQSGQQAKRSSRQTKQSGAVKS